MHIYIQKGGRGLTGSWSRDWFVCGSGVVERSFRKLSDAKAAASRVGASGKWERTTAAVGPRQMECVQYHDAATWKRKEAPCSTS